ncbi:hypothetical protein PIB30_084125, partial [Stylosanthes scabra]|nr:hypothetical protein [Stylosanthes scabra]
MSPRYSSDMDEERDFNGWRGDRDDEGDGGAGARLDVLDGLVGEELLEGCQFSPRSGNPRGYRPEWGPEGGDFSPWGWGWGQVSPRDSRGDPSKESPSPTPNPRK